MVSGDNGDSTTVQLTGPVQVSFSPDLLKSPDYGQLLDIYVELALEFCLPIRLPGVATEATGSMVPEELNVYLRQCCLADRQRGRRTRGRWTR